MKTIKLLPIFAMLGAACLALGGCQNNPPTGRADFDKKTQRTYNPQTGEWEQSPPFGKQSNKADTQ